MHHLQNLMNSFSMYIKEHLQFAQYEAVNAGFADYDVSIYVPVDMGQSIVAAALQTSNLITAPAASIDFGEPQPENNTTASNSVTTTIPMASGAASMVRFNNTEGRTFLTTSQEDPTSRTNLKFRDNILERLSQQ